MHACRQVWSVRLETGKRVAEAKAYGRRAPVARTVQFSEIRLIMFDRKPRQSV